MTNPSDNGPGFRILIVEDEIDCAENIALLLRRWGHTAEIAHDGPTALKRAQDQQPDVLLLDIGLPQMNGYEVGKRLRELPWQKKPLIIAMTGFEPESHRQLSEAAGIDLHLLKPVVPNALQDMLSHFQKIIS